MQPLFDFVEEILQQYPNNKDVPMYREAKRKLDFGPFSDIIFLLEKENQTLNQDIQLLQKQQYQNIIDVTSHELSELLTSLTGVTPTTKSYDILLDDVTNVVSDIEQQQRVDIERQRNNQLIYKKKKQQLFTQKIPEPTPIENHSQELSLQLSNISTELTQSKGRFKQFKKENAYYSSNIQKMNLHIKPKSTKLAFQKRKLETLTVRNEDLQSQILSLKEELDSVIYQLRDVKILQRFGYLPSSETEKANVQRLFDLRDLVAERQKEYASLEDQRTKGIIKSLSRNNENRVPNRYC